MKPLMVAFSINPMEIIAMEVMEVSAAIEVVGMSRIRPVIPVTRVKVMVHMTIKARMPVEPGASTKKYAAIEPLRPVVTVRCTVIRRITVIAVRTNGLRADVDPKGDLRGSRGGGRQSQAGNGSSGQDKAAKVVRLHQRHLLP